MSADEKNRNEVLSRIAAELFAKSGGGEEMSSKTRRIRNEIRKIIENDVTIFGKLRGLMVSFEEIIPEEKQRYNAAIKALSTTSKLTRQEIVKAVNDQLEELKILEKGLMQSHPGWRDDLEAMEAKSRDIRDEISKLREKLEQLESEEKGILNAIAARVKEMEPVKKAVADLFAEIGAEITNIKRTIEESTVEYGASQPIAARDSVNSHVGGEAKGVIQQDSEWQKKCPMCGGRMNLHSKDGLWLCYSCAHEEFRRD
jgi:DNA repair exonuclease SbcCD ATPase subunit